MDPIGPNIPGQSGTPALARPKAPDVFPPDTILGDAERRAKLLAASEDVVKTTAILAVIARAVPSLPGRIFATAIAGVGKTETGGVVPVPGTVGNFLPRPFGFMDPAAVGVQRNFYLPAGATEYVPRIIDRVGFGLPEQRIEDEIRRARLNAAAVTSAQRTAQRAVSGETTETLEALIAGQGGFTAAGRARAISGLSPGDLEQAARDEINRRAGFGRPPPVVPAAEALPGENPVVAAVQEVDRLFAANPPDP